MVFIIADGISPLAVQSQAPRLPDASLAEMLIGERPGLSAADSMGIYLTWAPRPGRTDAERSCISNIRPDGLTVGAAAELLVMLMNAARTLGLSGLALKPQSSFITA